MKKLIVVSVLLGIFSSAWADIISGVVTDSTDNMPIYMAKVSLDATHFTFTDVEGRFNFNTTVAVSNPDFSSLRRPSIVWRPGIGAFSWAGYKGEVAISVRNVRGALVKSYSSKEQGVGHTFALAGLPQGLYIAEVRADGRTAALKITTIGMGRGHQTQQTVLPGTGGPEALAKSTDVNNLTFEKNGYQNTAKTVTGSQSGVTVKMQRQTTLTISNEFLRVTYTVAAQTFTATSLARSLLFVKKGELSETNGAAKVTEITDSAFGAGQVIEVSYAASGNKDRIMLFPKQAFVMFRKSYANKSAKDSLVAQIQPVKATLGLSAPVAQLKCQGSKGLTTVSGVAPGSWCYLAVADPATRNGVVAGWMTNRRGVGAMFAAVAGTDVVFTSQLNYGKLRIKPGQSVDMELYVLGYFDNALLGLESYADGIAKVNAIKLSKCPVAFCTWQKYVGASDPAEMIRNVQWLKKNLGPFGWDIVALDAGWQKGYRYDDYDHNGPYGSQGMKPTADTIKSNGFMAGLWATPFSSDSTLDPSYFLRRDIDNAVLVKDGFPGISLEVTSPVVRAYLKKCGDLWSSWGYKYMKLDGIHSGMGMSNCAGFGYEYNIMGYAGYPTFFHTKYYDTNATPIDAYRQAVKIYRDALGSNSFILGCTLGNTCSTLGPSMGLFEAMRVGTDVYGNEWGDCDEKFNYDGWGAACGISSGSIRYFFNGRTFWVDPDAIFASMAPIQSRSLCGWIGLTGQYFESSERYTTLTADQVHIIKRAIPVHQLNSVRPVDLFDRWCPRIWLLTDTTKSVRRDVIGLFNMSGTVAWTESYSLAKLGLSGTQQYVGFDFWANTFIAPFSGNISIVLAATACRILAVRPVSENPILISTSRHVTQGVIDVMSETWDATTKTLSGTSKLVGGDPYELRIIAAKTGGTWTAQTASVSAADQTAGVTVTPVSQSGTGVRATINSATSREVKWSVTFN